nr:ribonuclease H-like domain, reverse transcriptase, RNA-dependent DNA polymerase [Tanacetum cinerariifolium]
GDSETRRLTILNTLDPLGKFQEKVDEGFLVGYSVCSKTFWTMNYHPVLAENQTNSIAGFQDIEKAGEERTQTYVLFPIFAAGLNFTNNTNDFSAVDPSNAAMPNLEDLSHNADDVGAEADINNMESIISEEVYVCQPPGFEDPDHPDKVYKVVKALYGLH